MVVSRGTIPHCLKRLKAFEVVYWKNYLNFFTNKNEYCIKSNLQAIRGTTGVSLPLISSIGSPVSADFLEWNERKVITTRYTSSATQGLTVWMSEEIVTSSSCDASTDFDRYFFVPFRKTSLRSAIRFPQRASSDNVLSRFQGLLCQLMTTDHISKLTSLGVRDLLKWVYLCRDSCP